MENEFIIKLFIKLMEKVNHIKVYYKLRDIYFKL